ncbi:uncharacterized protein with PQ loop repeat [Agromyces cerinus]|uniref:PQ-loop domain-containing transporter n=1 Tax=Agromyces cerinus TaxID=33878 RepID=UPI00195A6E00|nr:PQ-loop domain-containing transporter [Agromyces cerinus]MBM7831895.1 uncharacterized protein with PQ loop repeat [Agromyces cerinus]
MDIPLLAGTISTVVFAVSNLPMLRKALRTRDVSSYSLPSMIMINAANVLYSLYVFTLPFGPIWGLHTFYLVSCGIMLVLCLRARRSAAAQRTGRSRRLRRVEPGADQLGERPQIEPGVVA